MDFAGNVLNTLRAGARDSMAAQQQNNANALAPLQREAVQLGMDQTRQSMAFDAEQMAMARREVSERAAAGIRSQADAEALAATLDQGKRLLTAVAAGGPGADMAWREIAAGLGNPDLELNRDTFALAGEIAGGLDDALLSAASNARFGAPAPEAPAAFQTLEMRAAASGYQPGTPEYQQFMATGGRDQNVTRVGPDGEVYVGPVSGLAGMPPPVTPAAPTSGADSHCQNAPAAFGAGSVVRGVANRISDVVAGRVPFPDTLEAQRDFAVFGEGLINSFAAAYGRQPPSWLLRNIEQLTPKQGSLFEGPAQAQSKLRSISRELRQRREGFAAQVNSSRRVKDREDLMAQIAGIDATLLQLNAAMEGFSDAPMELAPEVEDILRLYE